MSKIKRNKIISETFLFFGALSMPLFLVNGFLKEPYISWALEYNHWLLTIALCLASLSASVVVALVLSRMENRIRVKFDLTER